MIRRALQQMHQHKNIVAMGVEIKIAVLINARHVQHTLYKVTCFSVKTISFKATVQVDQTDPDRIALR